VIAGLVSFCRDSRFRLLLWMYVIPLGLFVIGKGRSYYVGGAYPALMAIGAVSGEKWMETLPQWGRRTVATAFFIGVTVCRIYACALIIPIAASGPLLDFALEHKGDLREEIGWHELTQTVANIWVSLPPDERVKVGVLVGNYGEQDAVEILEPPYNLLRPINGTTYSQADPLRLVRSQLPSAEQELLPRAVARLGLPVFLRLSYYAAERALPWIQPMPLPLLSWRSQLPRPARALRLGAATKRAHISGLSYRATERALLLTEAVPLTHRAIVSATTPRAGIATPSVILRAGKSIACLSYQAAERALPRAQTELHQWCCRRVSATKPLSGHYHRTGITTPTC
jgi:hypothetical protein